MSADMPVPPPSDHNLADALKHGSGESGRTLRALVDLIPAGVLVCDVHGTITIHNAVADEILGEHVMDAVGRPRQGYALLSPNGSPLPPEDLPLSRAIRHGETTRDVEILVQRPGAPRRTILASGQPIRDDAGQITGAVAIFQDITEREHTVNLFAARERRQEVIAKIGQEALAGVALPHLFDDAVHLVAQTLDVEFVKVLELLPGQSELLLKVGVGWHEGLVGHAHVEAGRHSQAGFTLQSDQPVVVKDLRTEKRFQGPALLTDHGVVSGISVIIQGHPRPFGVLGAHTVHKRVFTRDDINFVQSIANVLAMAIERGQGEADRARLLAREQALAEIAEALVRERELSKVIDVVVDQSRGVLGADAVGVWLADPLRREMTLLAFRGKSPTVLGLLHTLSFDAPSLSARAALTGEPQVVTDIPSQHITLTLLQKVAATEGMRSALSLPLHSGGRLVGVITFAWCVPRQFSDEDLAFDATIADLFAVAIENARVYDLLRQALRVREEFMATAAHELRTPLTVIKGNTQIVLRKKAWPPRIRHALESVDKHVDRITRIVNDLLQSVEVRPGLATLKLERSDLSALAEKAAASLKEVSDGRTITLSTEGHIDVNAVPNLVLETIKRLTESAIRHSPSNGRVEVAVRRQGNEAIVSVTDHGVGVARDRQAHVFEPFYDLVPPGTPGYVGMSDLGLYLSKHVIEAHGGRIWHSNTPGGGSTITFSLPLASPSDGS